MIPSHTWFARPLQERAAWFENFALQFGAVGLSLGFTAGEITGVQNDNETVQFLAAAATELDAFVEAVRQFRIIITEGAIGEPTPAFPANPALVPPAPAVATGIFERLDDLVKRIRVAPAYTKEIGALLGIIPAAKPSAPEQELKPVIKASDSTGGFSFSVDVTRLGMPAYKIQIQRQGSSTWQDAAFATTNPCNVVVTPTSPGQPERILVRAILMKNNEQVGVPSDPTYVTINP
ncbi:MAG: hypothetical protein ABL999_07135 [Pyrinomonadaceae bacterium]